VLRLVVPKGSLERATFELFRAADLAIERESEVSYRASIRDPRITEVRILRPQEIPLYVAEGLFDLGITGRDWVEETGAVVESLGELRYSKASSRPIRVVVAVADASPVRRAAELPDGVRVATEYPRLTERYFATLGIKVQVLPSYGATEAKVPEIADAVVEITETGRALAAQGLRIVDEILVSYTELIANPASAADPERRHSMEQVRTLLQGALAARETVLVKLNAPSEALGRIIELLPAMKAPTVSELYGHQGFAVEAVVPREQINLLIPSLKDAGATDILELPLSKIVP
jgi:ATP phosphoribosyltransferase